MWCYDTVCDCSFRIYGMTMTPEPYFFEIEILSEYIQLCFVHLPRFVRMFFGDPSPTDFRRQKNRVLPPSGPLGPFFSESEFDKINKFKVLKKQVEWMAGKVAVKTLAEHMSLCAAGDLRISAEENGAPFLLDYPHISISISHSGDYAVAAMDLGGRGIALDIEAIEQGRMKNIMRVAFSENEIRRYSDSDDAVLYLNWTVKEAFLKYIKKGFAEGLKKVEVLDGHVFHHGRHASGITIDSRIIFKDYAFTLITAAA